MGEVYRARDTRLDRTVAIKILSGRYSEHDDARKRLEREAKAISALNHPHICALYDVGREGDTDYLVMEYVDGHPIHGPYPLEEALRLAGQILDALAAAHRCGITHRDLKPGNILVTKSGVKLLDFGLAKIETSSFDNSNGLDRTRTMTSVAQVTGTLPYMAPEQLEGKEADARTDIFAFGTVFYEMLTGKHAFDGGTQAGLIGAIMITQPTPITTVRPNLPRSLEWILCKCLEKDPDQRWQSAQDIKAALDLVAAIGLHPPVQRKTTERAGYRWIALAAASAVLAAGIGVYASRRPAAPGTAARVAILPPKGYTSVTYPAISPDGRWLAFGARVEGKSRVWVRPLDSSSARPLPGMDDANPSSLFWSPDSRSLGFLKLDGTLARIELSGGSVRDLGYAGANSVMRSSWSPAGVIVYANITDGRIYKISDNGGAPEAITTVDRSCHQRHGNPYFLPDGRRFIYSALGKTPEKSELLLGSLDAKENEHPPRVPLPYSRPVYVPGSPGRLLYVRDNVLVAQHINIDHFRLEGDPVEIANPVQWSVSASSDGKLAYIPLANYSARLQWRDRSGKLLGKVGDEYTNLGWTRLSPDHGRIAISFLPNESAANVFEVWILNLARSSLSRLTHDGGAVPVWSPDGSRIVFRRTRNGVNTLIARASDGSGNEEHLYESRSALYPCDWSRDGKFLLFTMGKAGSGENDLWVLPMTGERKPYPFVQARYDVSGARFSPDGKVVAYTSNETGKSEVYVQSFPNANAGKWQISVEGGTTPRWRADGRELFYRTGNNINAVNITPLGYGISASLPRLLFEVPERTLFGFDPTPDGQRFLLELRSEDDLLPVELIFNWQAALKR
ncbi:MAG: serine/threonine-protein kinase [Acidobacteriaceae bacterium]|nr:serine/threonine-protein kinase [Acidobacteriaceae bacterium]